MFEVLKELSKTATIFAPHNVLNALINGNARAPIFDESSSMKYSGYHPELTTNQMEKGITFSSLHVPANYTGQLDNLDKGEFTIFNNTNHFKKIDIEFYQDLYQVEGYNTGGRPYIKMSSSHPQIAPPRIVTLAPGGAEEVEFWYSTPPSPTFTPQYGDILYITIVVQMIDEQGKVAILRKKSKANIPAAP